MIEFLFAPRLVSLAFIIVMVMICFVAFYSTGRFFGKRSVKCPHKKAKNEWPSNEELAS